MTICERVPDRNGLENERCENCRGKVAWVGIWTNAVMVVMKVYVGLLSGSSACVADGLHSFSNIVTACAIIFSQKISSKKRTASYPLGFGKVEFLAAGFVSILIIGVAASIVPFLVGKMFTSSEKPPHLSAVLAAIISIITNELLFRYMRCVGTRVKSQTIMANAWANRADTVSSIAVVMGVVGAQLGFHYLDTICAFIVLAAIIRVSINILIESIRALMDSSLNRLYKDEILFVLNRTEGVLAVSDLKTRQVGQKIWAEIKLCVEQERTVKECRIMARKVKKRLLYQVMDLERISVYFEPFQGKCGKYEKRH